jgi:large subunit ribosomal protein L24
MKNNKGSKYKVKQDDQVMVVTGKDRGKTGKVLKVDNKNGRVIVQGLNMVKKAVKPKRQDEKGGIIDIEAALDISNIKLMCKKCGPTRVGYKVNGDEKIRICKKCGEQMQ